MELSGGPSVQGGIAMSVVYRVRATLSCVMAMKCGDMLMFQGVGVEGNVVLNGGALLREENAIKSSLERPRDWMRVDRSLAA